jgi:flagellar biogenesis protein FliO
MEQFFVHLAHAAIWVMVVFLLFAVIGFIAVVRWIVKIFRRGEAAVEGGVDRVEGVFKR